MRSIEYVGPFDEVEFPIAPGVWRRVKRGETVEVGERIAEQLLDQPANWADPNDAELPTGSAKDILAWVDNDPARAARALHAEESKGAKARRQLVEALTTITGQEESA